MSESFKPLREDLPTGLGNEKLIEGKDFLPLVQVDNVVEWVDDEVDLPFSLNVGEKTSLGMFLSPAPAKGEPTYQLEVEPDHGRSGVLGRVIFRDEKGMLYRDIDIKGMGYVSFPEDGKPPVSAPVSITSAIRGRAEGIQPIGRALFDLRKTKIFLDLNIRTQRVLALIRLKEIVDEHGKRVRVADARRKEMINSGEEDEPVLTLRAYGTRSRISDISNNETEVALKKLEDAKALVAQELNKDPENFSWEDYLEWYMTAMGRNVGKMHSKGWIHSFLTDHNMTLDARIVDLDSVTQAEELEGTARTVEKDRNDARTSLTQLCHEINLRTHLRQSDEELAKEMLNIFERAYEEECES